ncbi:hypothetical protein DRN82_03795 [Thermococci archaeon]|nr:MAG: hypothetical protein DRN82_03795 [Thermococci archaeon]
MFEDEGLRFRVRNFLKGVAALLLVVWVFRGWLGLEGYNEQIAWVIIALIFIIELLGVGKWFGITLSGIVFAVAKAFFIVALFIFVGGWLGLPSELVLHGFTITAKKALAYSIVLGIAGLLVARFDFPIRRGRDITPKVERKAYEFTGLTYDGVVVKGDGKAYPIKFGKKRVGWAIEGDVTVEVKTPIGTVRKRLIGPTVIWTRLNLEGRKVSPNPAFVETVSSMLSPRIYEGKTESVIDLGFLKVYEGEGFEYVKLPFLEVISTPEGEEVRIGPIKIHEGRPRKIRGEMFTIRELGNGFQLTKVDDRMSIVTDEFKIEIVGNKVTYRSGSEKLTVGDNYVSLSSGDISISVGKGSAKIRIEDAIISARDGKVKIRIGDSIHTIRSEEAFKLVLKKAKEIVEEQSEDVIEGLGVDKARLNRRVKELLDELMKFLG